MQNFVYHTPTKVFFGKDTHKNVGEIIKEYGYKKIMMQYGKSSIKKSGLYDEVVKSLRDNDIEFVEMGGVDPNPRLSFVYDAIEVAKKENVEFILAVGGGSVIDSCKFTALGVKYDGDVWDFPTGKAVPQNALPVGCILTISAAGSEMSKSAVITNTQLKEKRGCGTEFNRCTFSILNPELTYSVSPYQTACGIVDMMTHTMERYFYPVEPTPLTDSISEALLRNIILSAKVVMKNPSDYEARANLMWASSLSHNDLTGCGRAHALAVHQLEHALSGEYEDVPHGAGLALLYPKWARYVYKYDVPRFAQFARNVWGVEEADDEKAALCGIEEMEKFFEFLGMPAHLSDFEIPDTPSEVYANLCTHGKSRVIPSVIDLDYDRVKDIFDMCI